MTGAVLKGYASPMSYATNVVSTYLSATEAEMAEGIAWYDNAHKLAASLHNDVWLAAGVFAAYSINTQWPTNVVKATETLKTGKPARSLSVTMRYAQTILDGNHPLEVFGKTCPKLRAFTAAIADPANSSIATIDRHARDIAFGYVVDRKEKIGQALFRELSDVYIDVADMIGLSVAQTQAVTWVVWRNRTGKGDNG